MPPSQRLLAPRIQGFVCRSCLSKLQSPRYQRPPWLSRSVASETGHRAKEPKVKKDSHDQPGANSESVVRIFDQTPDGMRTEVGSEPGDEAFLESLQSAMEDMRKEMVAEGETEEIDEEELQERVVGRHMQNMVQGDGMVDILAKELESQMEEIGAEVDRRLENVDMENMSVEGRSKIREEIFQLVLNNTAKQPGPFSSSEPTQPDSPSNLEFPIDIQQQLPILIDALRSAATLLEQGRLNKLASNEIWNAYKLSRKGFVSNPDKVPGEIWETLWNIFTNPKTLNYGYLKILGQDMADADVPLQGWQRLAHIQAMFAEGDCDTAIKQWEECEMTMGRDNDTFKEYWEVGRRMYTRHNQLDKAVGAAEALIQSTKDASGFRSFLPIMNAVLHSKDKGREQKAWALYVRLKVGLGPQMEMKDYDAVASTFFGADLPDLALGVFRDMMLIGDASAGQHESTSIGNDPGVKSGLNLTNIGEKKLTWDDPRVLSKLPAKFNNKFFFGKWLKKLIGDGEYDASLKVFNLMHERGILPDARYVNGLIGAWLRTGKVNYHKLAEDTAWRMIQERLEYVKKQDTKTFLSYPLRPLVVEGKLDHKPIFRHPKATIETFSVLIEDYRRRQRHDRMKDLLGAFKQARIHPNTFFMNEMMMINSEVRQYYAWDTYTNLTQIQGVQPDFDTFGYLWFLTKKAVDPNINLTQYPKVAKEVQNTDVPRLMFAEMARWAHKLNRKERLPRELYNAIILCFSLAQDHPGTAVALRALQRHFNMFPNEDTVRTIVLQLARTGLNSNDSPARRQRVRFSVKKSPVVKERVVQVTKLLEGFKARRTDELLQQGVVFEELTGDERLEESLILMANLLRHVTQIRMEEDGDVAEIFEAAGRDMGVADCVP